MGRVKVDFVYDTTQYLLIAPQNFSEEMKKPNEHGLFQLTLHRSHGAQTAWNQCGNGFSEVCRVNIGIKT